MQKLAYQNDGRLIICDMTYILVHIPVLSYNYFLRFALRIYIQSCLDFSTFWITEPKCTKLWSEKVPDLFHLEAISPNLDAKFDMPDVITCYSCHWPVLRNSQREDRNHDLYPARHGGDTQQEENSLLVDAELAQRLHDLVKLHLGCWATSSETTTFTLWCHATSR